MPSAAAAGCKTYGQFNRGVRLLAITAFEDRLLLTPMRKVYRRGFEPIGAEKRMVDVVGDARLGAAARVALARAR